MAGRIVTIAQQKGSTGKTTVAAHLAVAWSRTKGRSVAILDVDPQGSLGQWLEAREARLGAEATGLGFRTASGWGARREANALARDYDLVLIDTPPKAEQDARVAMDVSDLVVIPVQPTPVDLWATEATVKVAAGEDTPAIMVVNRVPPRAKLTDEMMALLGKFDARAAKARLGNRTAFAAALGRGSSVLEDAPRSKAAAEVEALAQELWSRIGK
jgi:chromosome partitioning protein